MRGTRIVIIVLIVVAVLFAIGIGFGVKNDSKPTPADKICFPVWAKIFGSLLDPLRPKLQLDRKIFTVSSSKSLHISIPPDNDPFRIASFRLKAGNMATIVYYPTTMDEDDKKLQLPRKTCSKDKKDDPKQGSLAIFKEGGSLQISCKGNATCRIALE